MGKYNWNPEVTFGSDVDTDLIRWPFLALTNQHLRRSECSFDWTTHEQAWTYYRKASYELARLRLARERSYTRGVPRAMLENYDRAINWVIQMRKEFGRR